MFLDEKKQALRREILQKRKSLHTDKKQEWDNLVFEHTISLQAFQNAALILCYVSMAQEVDTRKLLQFCFAINKQVAVPKVMKNGEMQFFYLSSFDQLEQGHFGVMEPSLQKTKCVETYPKGAVCITPGLCFSKNGDRLGYGKGYYDKFFTSFKGEKIALTYSEFILDNIPNGEQDKKMETIISEKGVWNIG